MIIIYCCLLVIRDAFRRSVDRRETCVCFWDQTSLETHIKHIPNLKQLTACGDYCGIVYVEKLDNRFSSTGINNADKRNNDDDDDDIVNTELNNNGNSSAVVAEKVHLQLRNAIGAVVDNKVLKFLPKHVCMSNYYFAAANERTVYTWQTQSVVNKSGLGNLMTSEVNKSTDSPPSRAGNSNSNGGTNNPSAAGTPSSGRYKERMFDIDMINVATAQPPETYKVIADATDDPIACIATSDKFLVVARSSGTIIRFLLPHLSVENVYNVKCEPFRMELNCTSTRLALVDVA